MITMDPPALNKKPGCNLWGKSHLVRNLRPLRLPGRHKFPLAQLPRELVEKVFNFLEPEEILAFLFVSKSFSDLVLDPGTWERWLDAPPDRIATARRNRWRVSAKTADSLLFVPSSIRIPVMMV